MNSDNPILNSPYEEPEWHYATDSDGSLNYNDVRNGRRIFTPDINAIPTRQGPQGSMFEVNDYNSNKFTIKHPSQKIIVRVVSQFGEENTKVVGVKM